MATQRTFTLLLTAAPAVVGNGRGGQSRTDSGKRGRSYPKSLAVPVAAIRYAGEVHFHAG